MEESLSISTSSNTKQNKTEGIFINCNDSIVSCINLILGWDGIKLPVIIIVNACILYYMN